MIEYIDWGYNMPCGKKRKRKKIKTHKLKKRRKKMRHKKKYAFFKNCALKFFYFIYEKPLGNIL